MVGTGWDGVWWGGGGQVKFSSNTADESFMSKNKFEKKKTFLDFSRYSHLGKRIMEELIYIFRTFVLISRGQKHKKDTAARQRRPVVHIRGGNQR